MTKIVLLNNVDHADLRVLTGHGASFGDAINQVRIFATEFETVQREYPILLRHDDQDGFHAVALLGLDRDENLFLSNAGSAPSDWNARYIPALQRRGPFSIAVGPDKGPPAINVDLAHARVAGPGQGEPVFLDHGGNAPALTAAAAALAMIYDGMTATTAMLAAFADHALVEAITIEVTTDNGTHYCIDDVHSVTHERIGRLSAPALADLHARGQLAAAYWLAASLGTIDALIERKNRKLAGR